MKIPKIFVLATLILVVNSAFAGKGGGSSGGKGGESKGCLFEQISLALESARTDGGTSVFLPVEKLIEIAQICEAPPTFAACLAEQNVNGNPITDELITYCENVPKN